MQAEKVFSDWIPENALAYFLDKINKINRRAGKFGWLKLTVNILDERLIPDGPNEEWLKKENLVEVIGETPRFAGWELLAVIEHDPRLEKNVIRRSPLVNMEVPLEYFDAQPVCDHCGHNRFRKSTILLVNQLGEIKQVGTSCVKDFLGHPNVEHFFWLAKNLFELRDMSFPEDNTPTWAKLVDVHRTLAITSAVIRAHGWVSKNAIQKEFDEKGYSDREATSSRVNSVLFPRTRDEHQFARTIEIHDIDKQAADATMQYFAGMENPDSDYNANAANFAKSKSYPVRHMGLVVSMLPVYSYTMRKLEDETKRNFDNKVSNFLANIGEIINTEVFYKWSKSFESPGFGYYNRHGSVRYLYNFVDDNGNIIIWWTSVRLDLSKDQKVRIRGRVKKHNDYKGTKQTELTRCNVEEI